MLEHGGRLQKAAFETGIATDKWLDLSTGISPFSYPVPAVPQSAWHRLPEQEDDLISAAQKYYGGQHWLPVAGSQAVIQALPRLIRKSKVGFFHPSYNEHEAAWIKNGHQPIRLDIDNWKIDSADLDAIVLCNPNNPTGKLFAPNEILEMHALLQKRSGILLVDEAFMDATPEFSVLKHSQFKENFIVLRSLGKFFGLAGARVGFVSAAPDILQSLEEHLGPWSVSGPSRYIATRALQDTEWHIEAIRKLSQSSTQLKETLLDQGWTPSGGTYFFQWIAHPKAFALHEFLKANAILTRYFSESQSIRVGVPANGLQRNSLRNSLTQFSALTRT